MLVEAKVITRKKDRAGKEKNQRTFPHVIHLTVYEDGLSLVP
jgi:hypothetical protein